ncbi:MAG TPA: peptidase C45 [Rhodobacteraceae bacterium]|jgi:isopenicillin-N N-acyltransferase-like protein|nr:hypothetical protein [Paracoccaceae bacterium]HBG98949.1 peptidase C45 [Paracoccaceae bacterium]
MPPPEPIRLRGTPHGRGRALGAASAAQARAFLGDGLARLNHVRPDPLGLTALGPELRAYGAAIEAATPALWAELMGFAEAARLTPEQAVLLQTRREIMGYSRIPAGGDCTSMARVAGAQALLAQTVDLTCEMQDQIQVLDIEGEDIAGGAALVVSFTGLLGYLGMNAAGLAVGLNLVLAGDWGPGLPPYLAIRHLIDRADSVPAALDLLAGLPLASSRTFVLCDREEAAMVEAAEGELRVLRGADLTHANHFLHPDFVARDAINPFARNSSVRRRDAAAALLAAHPGALGAEQVMAAFAEAPMNVAAPYDMRREKTVAAVAMESRTGTLSLRRGNPAEARTETFRLRQPAEIDR